MRSKSPRNSLLDIAENLRLAREFVGGLDLQAFRRDKRTVYAVTRCLEIVSEASRRLPEAIRSRHPEVPWQDIAGAGNIYRHEYERVSEDVLWRTATQSAELLLAVVEAELARPENQ
jgi:uncharacterized protein with HEPN domain